MIEIQFKQSNTRLNNIAVDMLFNIGKDNFCQLMINDI
jgi:hypothetical protein